MTKEDEIAASILNIYRFFQEDGKLYLDEDDSAIDQLYDAVVVAIDDAGVLKATLPYNEFVKPCRSVLEGDSGWIGHFEDRDNRRFFLSDVYDYLYLFHHKKMMRQSGN